MAPTSAGIERLTEALRLDTPIIGLYDTDPSPDFEPAVQAKGRACCFAHYPRWLKGETLVVKRAEGDDFMNPTHGCPGLQKHFGFDKKNTLPGWPTSSRTEKTGPPWVRG